jgi:acyl-CoA synthetase (AMP-forming)/AMP-acid ligase II
MDPDVPLVVPEINPDDARHAPKRLIANPNCSTAIALMALWPLHQAFGVTRVFASTYQAVSGTGAQAIEELAAQSRQWAAETDGAALDYLLRLVDDDGNEVPHGTDGEILVRGPAMFLGYADPEQTRESLTDDGFFKTGDLGRLDSDGYLQIVGRQKDLIISGGFNIYPKEVELLLDTVPGVQESAVIGLPHPDFGEAVFAVLVPQAGVDLNTDTVLSEIGGRLARFKQPKAAVVVADLPRNTMGKVQKNVLRQTYAGWFLT